MLSKDNIKKLAGKAGKVLQIDWKDSPSLPKWYVTSRALVKISVTKPLCPGRFINRRSGPATWVFFKYEHLKTFCYDCGTLGHDQSHCDLESPAPQTSMGHGSALTTNLTSSLLKWLISFQHRNIHHLNHIPLNRIPLLQPTGKLRIPKNCQLLMATTSQP
ncbi:hypothetical protein CRG98_015786 [Punica granatum]|uniref:CCHC-type domain-containing protein n=1 Tax=Punica granatum TaxID=22663 RepID=A0A2I0K5I3_PUNGR|nr:hypothetical protein CRG98_015786 [Punica granatum]